MRADVAAAAYRRWHEAGGPRTGQVDPFEALDATWDNDDDRLHREYEDLRRRDPDFTWSFATFRALRWMLATDGNGRLLTRAQVRERNTRLDGHRPKRKINYPKTRKKPVAPKNGRWWISRGYRGGEHPQLPMWRAMYEHGASIEQIAARFDVHFSKVARHLHAAGVRVRPAGRAVLDPDRAHFERLAAEGKTRHQIAAEMQISLRTLYRHLALWREQEQEQAA